MLAFPRWFAWAVGLAGTTIALLQVSSIWSPDSLVLKLLAVGAGLCTWLAATSHSVQGSGGRDAPQVLRVLLPVLFVASLLGLGCAAPWRGAAIGISTVDRAAIKAAQEWEGYDVARENALIDEARTKNRPYETVKREVDAWRATADRVDLGFTALKGASSAAKSGVVMASQGKASIAGVLSALLDGVRAFLDVLRAAGVKLPGELVGLIGGVQ